MPKQNLVKELSKLLMQGVNNMNILKKIFEYIVLIILLIVLIALLIFTAFLVVKYPMQTIAFTLLFAFLVRTK